MFIQPRMSAKYEHFLWYVTGFSYHQEAIYLKTVNVPPDADVSMLIS